MKPRTFEEEMLIEGLVDDLSVDWAYTVVADDDGGCFEDDRVSAIGLILVLSVRGLIEPIGWDGDSWYVRSGSAGQIAAQMTSDWLVEYPDSVPTPGALGWFRNTAKGSEVAQTRLDSERDQ